MKSVRELSLILAVVLICAAGCGNVVSSDNQTNTDATSDTIEPDTGKSEEIIPPDIEAVDCGGADYTILCREAGTSYTFIYSEVFADEQNGEPMNDAVYKRNTIIEDKYNIELVSIESGDLLALAKRTIMAGDNEFDLIMPMISDAFSLAVEGLLVNMSDVPHIDTSKPWWMTSMVNATSIGGRNYFISGELNLSVFNAVGVTFFNKKLTEDLKFGNLYKVVNNGEWTIDKMAEYCRQVTNDINGNSEIDSSDRFGLVCSTFAWQPLYYGTGSSMITKDGDDIPHLVWDTDRNIDAIGKIVSLLNNTEETICVNHWSELQSNPGAATYNIFSEGRALFFSEVMYGAMQLRDMQDDFGILPLPKYDDIQEKYATYVHTNHSSTSCIPITNDNIDLAGCILEDMAYQSYLIIRPAFYEITLKGKNTRDEESSEMLDIIYDNINIDLTLVMNRSGLPIDSTLRSAMQDNRTDLASMIASQKSACEEIIKKNTDTILALD